jgi:chitin disaccharide deacetylase
MIDRPQHTSRLMKLGVAAACAAGLLPLVAPNARAQTAGGPPSRLAIRCDDVGMCHAVNVAITELIASGIPFSASVMTPCSWFLEAAAILARHPEVSVGVHLTLNSEWESYKWGPVLGRSQVPSLVDANGYLLASEEAFAARGPDLAEVEAELRAQIDRARAAGLKVDYLDAHMQTAYSTPALRALVERLAREYRLGIATYFGERSGSLWDVAPEAKLAALLAFARGLSPGLNLLVAHLGRDSAEMAALVDMNYPPDPFRVAIHRQAELDALRSPAFRSALAAGAVELVTYREVVARQGLAAMNRPPQATGYTLDLAPPK